MSQRLLLKKCCCGPTFTPGEDCEHCPTGQTPAGWTATVASMSLCPCSWISWEWFHPGFGTNRFTFWAFDLSGVDVNGTFCLQQCADDPCLWDSDWVSVTVTGTAKMWEGGNDSDGLESLPENKCDGTPVRTSTTASVRWVLRIYNVGLTVFAELTGILNCGAGWLDVIFYRGTSLGCGDDQEPADSNGCYTGTQEDQPSLDWSRCGSVATAGFFVGHDGGSVVLTKGCGA